MAQLIHRLVLLCVDAYCFIFWDLPGDVLAAVLLAKFSASVIFNENGHFLSHFLVKPITNQPFAGSGSQTNRTDFKPKLSLQPSFESFA